MSIDEQNVSNKRPYHYKAKQTFGICVEFGGGGVNAIWMKYCKQYIQLSFEPKKNRNLLHIRIPLPTTIIPQYLLFSRISYAVVDLDAIRARISNHSKIICRFDRTRISHDRTKTRQNPLLSPASATYMARDV